MGKKCPPIFCSHFTCVVTLPTWNFIPCRSALLLPLWIWLSKFMLWFEIRLGSSKQKLMFFGFHIFVEWGLSQDEITSNLDHPSFFYFGFNQSIQSINMKLFASRSFYGTVLYMLLFPQWIKTHSSLMYFFPRHLFPLIYFDGGQSSLPFFISPIFP